ncbi:MAG: hypothetical protein ACLPZM_06560 [Thermoplasmata archaeon]
MSESGTPYRTPYTATPGSSTTSPEVTPEEGKADLWGFFWLALLNTGIIVAVGLGTWFYVHHAL